MLMFELPEEVRRKDIKQLKFLLPLASDCFLASLLPLSHIFAANSGNQSKPAICQCLKRFFEQLRLEGCHQMNESNETFILS